MGTALSFTQKLAITNQKGGVCYETEKPHAPSVGAGRGTTGRPEAGGPVRCGGGTVWDAPLLCRGSDHSRPIVWEPGILVLPDLVRSGARGLPASGHPVFPGPVPIPQGHLCHPEIHPGESAGETAKDASGYDSGHLQRPDEAGHRGSGGEHGAAPGPSSAGDDRQCAGAGVHPDLSVRAGLADGPFESGVHPGGHGLHDGGHGRLRQAVRGLGQDNPGHEQRHCGVHRRH